MKEHKKSEMAILGCIIITPKLIEILKERVEEKHFVDNKNKIILKAMFEMQKENTIIDIVLLSKKLQNLKQFEFIGGDKYLAKMVEVVASTLHFSYYLKELLKDFFERERLNLLTNYTTDVKNNNISQEDGILFMNSLVNNFDKASRLEKNKIDINEYAIRAMDILEKSDPIKTGYNFIDANMSLQKGEFCIIGARPEVGKSLFAINLINSFLRNNKKVLVSTTEMKPEQYLLRMTTLKTGINNLKLRQRNISETEARSVVKALGSLSEEINLNFISKNRPSIDDLRTEILETKPDIFILDALKFVNLGNYEKKYEAIEKFINQLQGILIEQNVLGIIIVHLKRESEAHKIPKMSDAKECSGIEDIADSILLLFNGEENANFHYKNINYIIAKNRWGYNGLNGTILLNRKNLQIEQALDIP